MPKRTRKLTARQADIARKRRLRRRLVQMHEQAEAQSEPVASDAAGALEDEAADSREVGPSPISRRKRRVPQSASGPWAYAYVLADLKRIALLSATMFILLAVLAIFLR